MRIEDTDPERSKKEYEEAIFEDLKWLGLDYDNKDNVWRSTERNEIYKEKIQELIKKGAAYVAELQEGETDESKRVVRFKNPGGKIKFQDLIRGEVEIDVSDLNDFVIARNIEDPIYHLAVCVDDSASGITHIIRGDDHISNTPRQILIIEALGGKRPIYAHLPLVLAEDKSKLSKRKHGEGVSLRYYKEKGYEPVAIINFLALIGWNPGGEKEIFTLEELVEVFDLSKVQKKGGIFNVEKLDWINKQHILLQPKEVQLSKFKDEIVKTKWKDRGETALKLFEIMLDRIHRWGEVSEILNAEEFDYFFETPVLDRNLIAWKKSTGEKAKENLEKVLKILDDWEKIERLATEVGKGDVLWPLRYALSGREKSPDPKTLLSILDPEESKKRIKHAIEIL